MIRCRVCQITTEQSRLQPICVNSPNTNHYWQDIPALEELTKRAHLEEPLQSYKHTTSSKKPHFELIPYNALVELADRYALGQEKHKAKAWNPLSNNQAGLEDEDWIMARASHIIHHVYQYILKRRGIIPDDGDNDSAAIMWGGSVLSEANRVKRLKGETV